MGFLDRPMPFGGHVKRPTQFYRGRSFTVPAPYGGINLRDDITALKPNEARVLQNWFPDSGKLRMRDGFTGHATGVGSAGVETLATLRSVTSDKMVGAANGGIYDCTAAGAATSKGTGFTEDTWQHDNFNNRLFLVNGTDAPQDYDGSTLSATSWTGSGLTLTDLVNVANVRNRLWFCENDTADVWYGGIGSITGTLTKFQLSQIASGGYCMAIGSWSRDAGDGADDYTVFVMNTGQIIIYQGDPAATFSLVGKYDTGAEPVGRQCLVKVGGELVVITRLGLLPVSAAVAGGKSLSLSAVDPWGKISPQIAADAASFGALPGWSGHVHNGVVYINVPVVTGVQSKQHVLNTRTGGWATFTGWKMRTMTSYNNQLYIGSVSGGTVNQIGGTSDNGADIVTVARCAFSIPSRQDTSSLFKAMRLKLLASGNVSGFVGVDTDYFDGAIIGTSVSLSSEIETTPWGSDWGSPWGGKPQPLQKWISVEGNGRAVAPRVQAFANDVEMSWFASDILLHPGSIK